jgi:hypothetical protein
VLPKSAAVVNLVVLNYQMLGVSSALLSKRLQWMGCSQAENRYHQTKDCLFFFLTSKKSDDNLLGSK